MRATLQRGDLNFDMDATERPIGGQALRTLAQIHQVSEIKIYELRRGRSMNRVATSILPFSLFRGAPLN